MSFYTRYANCCKQKKIAPVSQEAAEKLGCSRANISFLAKREVSPKGEIVARAAKMLGVSADYLLELTDEPIPLGMGEVASVRVKEALLLLNTLNEEGQNAALAMLKGLALQGMYISKG